MSKDEKSAIEQLAEAKRDKAEKDEATEVADEERCPNCGTPLATTKPTADDGQEVVLSQTSLPEPKQTMKFSDSWIANLLSIIVGGIILLGMCKGCSWVGSYDWTCSRSRKSITLWKLATTKEPFYCAKLISKKKPKPLPSPPPLPCPVLDSKDLDCWPDIVNEWKAMQDGGVGAAPTAPPTDAGDAL